MNSQCSLFQSVVIITRLPFVSFFTEICALIAPEFFDNGEPSIEAACHDIDQWPNPIPGETVNLPLLGTILQVTELFPFSSWGFTFVC